MQRTLSLRVWLGLTSLALIWGASFLAIRTALDEIPPMTSVLHRVGWAALVLWIVVWLRGVPLPRDPRIWGALLMMGVMNNVIPFGLMAWGQLYIETGLTSIFNAATAIWAVLLSALFLADERLTGRRALGVALGFGGVVLAIGPEALRSFDLRSLAQLAVLAGTLSYALAGVWARLHLAHLPPEISAAGMLTGATLIMAPLALLLDGPPSLALQPITWLAIAYYALMATAVAYLLYYSVLAAAGSSNLMLVTLMIPPVAITLGTWLHAEALAPNAYLGFCFLALGLVMLDGRLFRRKAP